MNRRTRRFVATALVIAGVALMLIATDTKVGLIVLAGGIVVELGGMWLERRR